MNSEEIKAIRAAKRVAEMQAPPINSDFISISELLARLQTTPDKPPRTMTDAAEWMLFNWCNAENPPAWKCNGKLGIVPINGFSEQHEIPLNRLNYVFHRGHFESDDGNGPSLDYEHFGFDRHEFAAFMNLLGEPLDLFCPMTQPAPAQTAATPAPVVQATKRRTWWDVSSPYIVDTMRAGQYATAKELFNALEAKAGSGSPFDKGTGNNRFSLFIRELATPLSLKTMQNNWQELLKAAAHK